MIKCMFLLALIVVPDLGLDVGACDIEVEKTHWTARTARGDEFLRGRWPSGMTWHEVKTVLGEERMLRLALSLKLRVDQIESGVRTRVVR